MPCRGSRSRPVLMSAMTSCQDGVRSTYPRSTDIRICLQRPFHPEAIVRTFGRHAVTGTAVVGSESTTWSVAAGFKQPVRSAAIGFWCTNKLPELRPLYHCVFGGSTRGTCVLEVGGGRERGPRLFGFDGSKRRQRFFGPMAKFAATPCARFSQPYLNHVTPSASWPIDRSAMGLKHLTPNWWEPWV